MADNEMVKFWVKDMAYLSIKVLFRILHEI